MTKFCIEYLFWECSFVVVIYYDTLFDCHPRDRRDYICCCTSYYNILHYVSIFIIFYKNIYYKRWVRIRCYKMYSAEQTFINFSFYLVCMSWICTFYFYIILFYFSKKISRYYVLVLSYQLLSKFKIFNISIRIGDPSTWLVDALIED